MNFASSLPRFAVFTFTSHGTFHASSCFFSARFVGGWRRKQNYSTSAMESNEKTSKRESAGVEELLNQLLKIKLLRQQRTYKRNYNHQTIVLFHFNLRDEERQSVDA